MTDKEIKEASERVFDALLGEIKYTAVVPEHEQSATLLNKIFRHHYTELIANAIRGSEDKR